MNLYLVFDVESVGLHGEAFAVGYTLINDHGEELDYGMYACPEYAARGSVEGFAWVSRNCPDLRKKPYAVELCSPYEVRREFWDVWDSAKEEGAMLAADVSWPVEARFLLECLADRPGERDWHGPYPLLDISSV